MLRLSAQVLFRRRTHLRWASREAACRRGQARSASMQSFELRSKLPTCAHAGNSRLRTAKTDELPCLPCFLVSADGRFGQYACMCIIRNYTSLKPGRNRGGGLLLLLSKKAVDLFRSCDSFSLVVGAEAFPATLGYVADCGGSIADAERKANDVGNKQAGATLNGVIKLFSSSGERLRNRPEHERSTSGRNDWKRKQVIGCKNQPMTCDNQWCPRRDSNARHPL